MSISGALSNALSGLTAASRTAEVVASNVSNAATEGYASRQIELAGRMGGSHGGVMVVGMTRHVDHALLSDRRMADSDFADSDTRARFLARVSDIAGMPGAPGALGTLLTEFDAALISAASQPDSVTRLDISVGRAGEVVERLNTMSRAVQDLRQEADGTIAAQVTRLNELLNGLQDVAPRLVAATSHEKAALLDHRDRIIDDISQIVPVRVAQRANDGIALYTPNGAILFDGQAAEIGFARTPTIMPHMTEDAGLLSGLTINGLAMRNDPPGGALRGASLGALFAMRDDALVSAQAQLDGVARELAERFQGAAIDPTLTPGSAGLFTDGGAPVVPADEIGLAGRLRLNAAVDPAAGGLAWKLRDGLAAATPGPTGNGAVLTAMSTVLAEVAAPGSTALSGVARSLHGLVADVQSGAATSVNEQDRRQGFVSAQRDALLTAEREGGVDTDAEMQRLMLVEQSYAANARMMETVGKLIDTLMRI